jgi:Ice-binding-like
VSVPVRRTRGFILLSVVLALTLVAAVAFLLSRSGGMNMSMAARGLQADSARYIAEAGLAQINYQTQNLSCTGYADLPATTDLPPTKFGADNFTATVTPKAGSPVNFSAIGTTVGGAAATLTRSNVTVSAALSPVSAGDTTLDSLNATNNYGANQALTLSYTNNNRALLKFDFSGIPSGARITSATLQLNKRDSSGSSVSVSLYRVTTPWTEGTGAIATGATYKTSNGSCLWSAAGGGGDYDPVATSSIVADKFVGLKSWEATSLVQGWVDGSYANYGMILVPTSGGDGGDFISREANATLQPKLLVSYKCGSTGLPTALPGPAPVIPLGTAENFVILTKAAITDVPISAITGNIGASPIDGASIGVPCAEVTGSIFSVDPSGPLPCRVTNASCLLTTAVGDMETAYNDAAGRAAGVGPLFLNVGGGTLAGKTLGPGTYTWTTPVTITTDLTLSGGPNDVWIFQMSQTLDMASAKKVILLGGARARNIFWQVAGAVTLGTTSHFEGTVLGKTSIVMLTQASISGRLFAQTALTLQMNVVTQPPQ